MKTKLHGLTLIETIFVVALIALLLGGIATIGLRSYNLNLTTQAKSLGQLDYSRLVNAFNQDVRSGLQLTSDYGDPDGFTLLGGDGVTYVTYRITGATIERGYSSAALTPPAKWEELIDSSLFHVTGGQFAYYTLSNSEPTSSVDVRRVDLQGLSLLQINSNDALNLPLLSAYMRSRGTAPTPAPSGMPTSDPTIQPTSDPTNDPSVSPPPTATPGPSPTVAPTPVPTASPAGGSLYAILAGDRLVFKGNTTVNSSPTGKGNVHSNVSIALYGTSSISGTLSTCGTVSKSGLHPAPTKTGAAVVPIPSYTSAQITSLASAAKNGGIYDLGNGLPGGTLRGYYRSSPSYDILNAANTSGKKVKITGNNTWRIDGIVFLEGSLDISGYLYLSGSGMLICTEPITLHGNTTMAGANRSSFALVSLSNSASAIDLGSSTHLTGIVFAPRGGITGAGNLNLTGCAIMGGAGTFNGSPVFNFSPSQTLSILQADHTGLYGDDDEGEGSDGKHEGGDDEHEGGDDGH